MAEFQARCPHCGTIIRYPETQVGSKGQCAICAQEFLYPGPGIAPFPSAGESPVSPASGPVSVCPSCGSPRPATPAKFCPFCGASLLGLEDVPWEHRREIGFRKGLVRTIGRALFNPSQFFQGMRTAGGLGSPLLFAVIVGTIGGWFAIGYQLVGEFVLAWGPHELRPTGPRVHQLWLLMFFMLASPLTVALTRFLLAGILHLCLMIVGGARRDFEATFRVVCYASAADIWMLVPACGWLVSLVWAVVCTVIGFIHAHQISAGRAVLAVLIPFILAMCCCTLGVTAIVVAIMGGYLS